MNIRFILSSVFFKSVLTDDARKLKHKTQKE